MILQDIFNKALTLLKDFPRSLRGIPESMSRTFPGRRKIAGIHINATGIPALTLAALTILPVSCSKWTGTESVRIDTVLPWEQDPGLWEDYKAVIRDYKSREHSLVYVRFENSPEGAVNEKGYMRCLPDSLDIVSLTNAENFSEYDAEDMEWMRSVGTKVLYQLDFAGNPEMLYDNAQLTAAIDRAVSTAEANGLAGFSFTGLPKDDGGVTEAASRAVVGRLSAAAGTEGILAFEGNPVFISQDDLGRIDLFVLASETDENAYEVRNTVLDAQDWGVPKEKMLLAADFKGEFYDSDNASADVLTSIADQTIILGPMAGLALYNIESDYYHYDGDWLTVRSLISRLNP